MPPYQTMTRDRVWVEVNLDHLAHNIQKLKEIVGPEVLLLPLLKANAYGCGIAIVGKVAIENRADWLGVELVEEALELRQGNITAPILVVGPLTEWQAESIVRYDLHVTVRDEETLKAIASYANAFQKVVPIHIELDTGLHRLGLQVNEALNIIQHIEKIPLVKLEGVWTHFASSDDLSSNFTWIQFAKFQSFIKLLREKGIDVPIQHVANSAALIQFPELRLNMSRCGETVYGLAPRRDLHQLIDLKPVVAWKTRLIWVQQVAVGVSVGYGQKWIAKRESRVGTISVGYADGYRRSFSRRGHTLVRGKIAPIAGRISMQMAMIDLTDIPDAIVNDEVVLMGQQDNNCITAYDLADWADTGEFEILVGISSRIPRRFLDHRNK